MYIRFDSVNNNVFNNYLSDKDEQTVILKELAELIPLLKNV